MKFCKIKTNELMNVLLDIKKKYGNLSIYTLNENDDSLVYDYILSDTMEMSIEDIIQIDEKVYIKDRDYDEWLNDRLNGNEDFLIKIISKRHPELKDIAIKILKNEIMDGDWEDSWNTIMPIIEHCYLNDLEWEEVMLITNYN